MAHRTNLAQAIKNLRQQMRQAAADAQKRGQSHATINVVHRANLARAIHIGASGARTSVSSVQAAPIHQRGD